MEADLHAPCQQTRHQCILDNLQRSDAVCFSTAARLCSFKAARRICGGACWGVRHASPRPHRMRPQPGASLWRKIGLLAQLLSARDTGKGPECDWKLTLKSFAARVPRGQPSQAAPTFRCTCAQTCAHHTFTVPMQSDNRSPTFRTPLRTYDFFKSCS